MERVNCFSSRKELHIRDYSKMENSMEMAKLPSMMASFIKEISRMGRSTGREDFSGIKITIMMESIYVEKNMAKEFWWEMGLPMRDSSETEPWMGQWRYMKREAAVELTQGFSSTKMEQKFRCKSLAQWQKEMECQTIGMMRSLRWLDCLNKNVFMFKKRIK